MFQRKKQQELESAPRAAKTLLKALEKLDYGCLKLTTPEGHVIEYKGSKSGPSCEVRLFSWDVLSLALDQSDVGLGEAYMDGLWDTPSLPDFLILICINERALTKAFQYSPIYNLLFRFRNLLRKNSKSGSRKNILSHYDLGNDFYKLWLDPSMTYSSGLYQEEDCLISSQKKKMELAVSLLSPSKGQSILEVGCGWGSFLEYASREGYLVEGVTISPSQRDHCQERLKGLAAKVNLLDYRDLKQTFDHIVSIEMFEAVGQEYWKTFLGKISQCLHSKGSAVIQTITIRDDLFDTYQKSSDFIRSHIFPGGFLPSPQGFKAVAEKMKFKVEEEVSFGKSYEKTLRAWLENFNGVIDKVKGLGFDDRFIRMWQYYLATCIAGFATERTNVHQFKLVHQ